MDLNLNDKGFLVEGLWHAVDDAANNLEAVPRNVRRVIETEAWRERICRGRKFTNATFLEFITDQPLKGCGWSPEKVEALLKDEPEVLTLWREATKVGQGKRTDLVDIVNEVTPAKGNSRAYTLDRLKRARRDLFDKVCAGELSANAAAIEAGFRKKPTVYVQILKLIPKLTDEERDMLVSDLMQFNINRAKADQQTRLRAHKP